jgi:hypothetical protein
MLDRWLNVIAQRLGTYTAAVNAQRAAIEKERAGDEARDHAGREFVNPEGYTTPLPKNAQNKQNEYARARREYEEADLPRALAAAATLMIARERRDEAVAALKAHLDAEDLRRKEGVHPEVKPFFDDMFKHGIPPRRLPHVRAETRAIIYDILMWDGHDPDMVDPASPMPAIFDLYASRLIVKPGNFGDKSRSALSSPTNRAGREYYQFSAMVKPNGGATVAPPSEESVETEPVTFDCSIYPDDTKVEAAPGDHQGEQDGSVVTADEFDAGDEIRVIENATADELAILRQAAERLLENDADWLFDLEYTIGQTGGGHAEVIAAVEAAEAPHGVTPFSHFLDEARLNGVSAGRAAYRAAAVRRTMIMIATLPDWSSVRRQLGLSW